MPRNAKPRSDVALNLVQPINLDSLVSLATRYASKGIADIQPQDLNQGRCNDNLALHQPVLLQMAAEFGMPVAVKGHARSNNEKPDNWHDNLPAWEAGLGIQDKVTCHGIKDIRKNVDNPGKHLVSIGDSQYVIGNSGSSALNVLQASDGKTNYAVNLMTLKKLCFRSEQVANLVYRVNNTIDRVAITGSNEQHQVVFLPNQYATAGFLTRNGVQLNYSEIQQAVETNNTADISFTPLASPIFGERIRKSDFLNEVKKNMQSVVNEGVSLWDEWVAESTEEQVFDKIWNNVSVVQTRSNPDSLHCFGFRCAAADTVIARGYGENREDQVITMIIGLRCGDNYTTVDRDRIENDEKNVREKAKLVNQQQKEKAKLERKAKRDAEKANKTLEPANAEVISAEPVTEPVTAA